MSREEALVFPCNASALVGILHRAEGAAAPAAVLVVVGGPQYRVGSHRQFVAMSRAIAARGFPVLRFDYRGMGDSEGHYRGFEGVSEDIRSAVDALEAAAKPEKGVILLGLCDAASASLMYCTSDPRVAGLVLINPWVRSGQTHAAAVVKHYYGTRILQRDFWRKIASGEFRLIQSLKSLLANLAGAFWGKRETGAGFIERMREGLLAFRRPILLARSGRDLTADEFRGVCGADAGWASGIGRPNVRILDIPEADHTFSQRIHVDAFNDDCCRWLERNFGSGIRAGDRRRD